MCVQNTVSLHCRTNQRAGELPNKTRLSPSSSTSIRRGTHSILKELFWATYRLYLGVRPRMPQGEVV